MPTAAAAVAAVAVSVSGRSGRSDGGVAGGGTAVCIEEAPLRVGAAAAVGEEGHEGVPNDVISVDSEDAIGRGHLAHDAVLDGRHEGRRRP